MISIDLASLSRLKNVANALFDDISESSDIIFLVSRWIFQPTSSSSSSSQEQIKIQQGKEETNDEQQETAAAVARELKLSDLRIYRNIINLDSEQKKRNCVEEEEVKKLLGKRKREEENLYGDKCQ